VASSSITVASVSGGGATWQKLTNTVDGVDVELWLGTVTTTGSSTITVSYSGSISSTSVELSAQEYTSSTGPTTVWSSDVVGNAHNDSSSTTVTFPSLTPSTSGELYVGYARVQNTGAAGSTSGFTYDVTSPNTNVYIFNPSVSGAVSPAAAQSPSGTSVSVGALLRAGSPTVTTASTWDVVSGGSIPLNLNDATTSSATPGTTTNTSYLYGDLLFGGTAPVEQITTTASGTSVSYLVSNPTGVQGVYSGNSGSYGSVQEMAVYTVYGNQSLSAGTRVTPFGFQGSYTDPTGLIYLINRFYDPVTDQFLSVDSMVGQSGLPYVFTNDNPLNATDPVGALTASVDGGAGFTMNTFTNILPSPGIYASAPVSTQTITKSIGTGTLTLTTQVFVTVPLSGSASSGSVIIDASGNATVSVGGASATFSSAQPYRVFGVASSGGFGIGSEGLSFTASKTETVGGASVTTQFVVSYRQNFSGNALFALAEVVGTYAAFATVIGAAAVVVAVGAPAGGAGVVIYGIKASWT